MQDHLYTEEEVNKLLKEQAQRLEQQYRTSYTWRIGSMFVKPVFKVLQRLRQFTAFLSITRNELIDRVNFLQIRRKKNTLEKEDENVKKVGVIFDDFTTACFAPEFKQTQIYPFNIRTQLVKQKFDFILVESVWRGAKQMWKGKVGKYERNGYRELKTLIKYANKLDIPIAFWNKEDPVHFEHFISAAELFPVVFTSDANSVIRYQKKLGHTKIYPLTFAAQPNIHHPIGSSNRVSRVCFAGSYWNNKYYTRQRHTDLLLDAAKQFGLDIYDRNHSRQDNATAYQFPLRFQSCILGGVPYNEMLNLYRHYKVFLNVNSVTESPTMLARRVFELLACGTPVISTPSAAIINLFEDECIIVNSEEDAIVEIDKLLNDEHYWYQKSLAGMRKVHTNFTYHNRFEQISNNLLTKDTRNLSEGTSFILICSFTEVSEIYQVEQLFTHQTYQNFEIIFLCTNAEHSIFEKGNERVQKRVISNIFQIKDCLRKYSHIGFINSECFYGKYYLEDYSNAFNYGEHKSQVVGKASIFKNDLDIIGKAIEYDWVDQLYAPTLIMTMEYYQSLTAAKKDELITNDFIQLENNALAIDRYNFCQSNLIKSTDYIEI